MWQSRPLAAYHPPLPTFTLRNIFRESRITTSIYKHAKLVAQAETKRVVTTCTAIGLSLLLDAGASETTDRRSDISSLPYTANCSIA
jgi:hypothetical protein